MRNCMCFVLYVHTYINTYTHTHIHVHTYIHMLVGALLESYGLPHQLYADDVQAYTHCTSDQAVGLAAVAQMCLAMDALSAWLASNRLLLNASKTQFIWLGGGKRLAGVNQSSVAIAFPHICFQDSVRDLGVILDQELSFALHITSSLAPAIISSASCELCLALCPAALQPPSYMHLSQVGWTTVARSWRACL